MLVADVNILIWEIQMIGITEGDIMSLLGDFERIIILKTLIYDIDLNFLDLEDLEKIENEFKA